MEFRNINDLVLLENNPRTISKTDFEKLKTSLKNNTDYSKARPVILSNRTGKLVVIGGNQRVRAYKELGIENIPTYLLEGLTEEREREIIIRDNVSNGEWDMEKLANEWDIDNLADWGVEIAESVKDDIEKEKEDLEKYERAKELKKRDDFIILTFVEEIDWLQALSYFNIKKEELPSTKRNCDGKLKRIGEGYVIDGSDFINKIEQIKNENKL